MIKRIKLFGFELVIMIGGMDDIARFVRREEQRDPAHMVAEKGDRK